MRGRKAITPAEMPENEATRAEEKPAWKIGDVVEFTGKTHYIGSTEKYGTPCKPGIATVTGVRPRGKHPYHLIRKPGCGATVYGWVDAEYITTP